MWKRPSRMTACLIGLSLFLLTAQAFGQQPDPLPAWSDGPAKKAILEFVRVTTEKGNAKYVPPEQRIATFDQDGTLWVEHPMYTQVMYCLDRVPALVKEKPGLKDRQPFKTVLSGDHEAMAKLSIKELEEILEATLTGMTVDDFQADVKKWLATAKHPRYKRPYTELTYQPMLEVLKFFRANGYKTYIVTGGGQDFVRVYAEQVYGIPPEQVVGTMGGTKYGYDKDGKPILTKEPKLLLNDNDAGKPEGIHLMIGRRPLRGVRQLDRRPANAGVHHGRRRRPAGDAGPARRCQARIRLRPGARAARHQGRHFHPGPVRRGEETRLGGDQHEERLEPAVPVRQVTRPRGKRTRAETQGSHHLVDDDLFNRKEKHHVSQRDSPGDGGPRRRCPARLPGHAV